MSLLDDVSIVVTPNGYKAGELYAVIPVPTEGTEEGTNMDFSSGTSPWALNSNWSLGGVGVIADGTSNSTIWQGSVLEDNKQYIVTYTLTDFLQGSVNVELSGSNGISRTIAGTYTEVITSGTSPTTRLSFEGSGNFKVTLSNVIVKEYTSADMDVTRATAATRVDENGLVNYAEVLGGEEIDNGKFTTNLDSWSTSSWWVWNSLGAYHPSTSLHKPLYQQCCVIGKTYLITFDLNCVGSSLAKFSLGSSTGSTTQVIDINLESGSYSYFVTAAAEYIIFNRQNTAEYYVNNVSVKEAARDNVPRIDYTGGGCPHILAEPQRTNLVPYSEDFSQYTNSDTTDTANTVTSPDGTVNGTTLTASGSGSLNHIITSPTYTIASGEITSSIFAKKGTVNYIRLRLNGTTGGERAWYNLNNGTIDGEDVSSSAKIEDYGNGWYRCSLTSSSNIASGSGKSLQIFIQDSGGSQTAWTANGTENIYIWGTQTEQGSYATSYIPTSGSTVTRNQDIFTRDGIGSLINSTEGVLFVEIAAFADYTTYRYMGLTDGNSDNRVIILYYNSSTRIRVLLSSGGTKYFDAYYAVTSIEDFHKVALKWKENDFALWIDGVERATETSGLAPIGLNTVALDQAGGDNFYGKVKQLQVYDTALTDEQLLQLTGESGTDFYESYAEMASALTYTIQ